MIEEKYNSARMCSIPFLTTGEPLCLTTGDFVSPFLVVTSFGELPILSLGEWGVVDDENDCVCAPYP